MLGKLKPFPDLVIEEDAIGGVNQAWAKSPEAWWPPVHSVKGRGIVPSRGTQVMSRAADVRVMAATIASRSY
jgi:hypothetical protein